MTKKSDRSLNGNTTLTKRKLISILIRLHLSALSLLSYHLLFQAPFPPSFHGEGFKMPFCQIDNRMDPDLLFSGQECSRTFFSSPFPVSLFRFITFNLYFQAREHLFYKNKNKKGII